MAPYRDSHTRGCPQPLLPQLLHGAQDAWWAPLLTLSCICLWPGLVYTEGSDHVNFVVRPRQEEMSWMPSQKKQMLRGVLVGAGRERCKEGATAMVRRNVKWVSNLRPRGSGGSTNSTEHWAETLLDPRHVVPTPLNKESKPYCKERRNRAWVPWVIWVGRDIKEHLVPTSLLWAEIPPTRPGSSNPHPTLNASRDETSTASPGSLLQCTTTFTLNNFYLIFHLNLLSSSVKPLYMPL